MLNQKKENFLEELRKNVPNRDVCRVATKEQIEQIMAEVNFEFVDELLENRIMISHIPEDILFEMVLYVLSTTEWEEEAIIAGFTDFQIFNLEDKKTRIFINVIKKMFGIPKSGDLIELKLDDFLLYAKSDQPDF